MAVDMTAALSIAGDPGYYLVGEFLGVDMPRDYTDRRTNEAKTTRPAVRLLVGRRVEVVQFRDMDALDTAIGSPAERAIVAVPVFLNGPWDEQANRPGSHNATPSGRAPRTGLAVSVDD